MNESKIKKQKPNKPQKPRLRKAGVIKSFCHICGDDTGKHTPDCTSYIYGITNGQNVL